MVKPVPERWRRWGAAALVACALWPGMAASATGGPQAICEAAARRAAAATGVPLRVLLAVSLSESGRKLGQRFAAWPWTLNIGGQGAYLDTRAAALARAQAAITGGQTSVDLGCFQVNYRWHGEAFASLAAMLDPDENALYAARFLRDLFAESGDWTVAAGHYHSRTPHFANRYRKVFDRHLAALGTGPLPLMPPAPDAAAASPVRPAPARTRGPNRFPLLQSGGAPVSMGSLVPTRPGGASLLEGRGGRSMWGG